MVDQLRRLSSGMDWRLAHAFSTSFCICSSIVNGGFRTAKQLSLAKYSRPRDEGLYLLRTKL